MDRCLIEIWYNWVIDESEVVSSSTEVVLDFCILDKGILRSEQLKKNVV